MDSSLKFKFNQQTGEFTLTNANGDNLAETFPYIQDVDIHISATDLPKIVITCTCLDFLEFETDGANIEKRTVQLGYIKEKKEDGKQQSFTNGNPARSGSWR